MLEIKSNGNFCPNVTIISFEYYLIISALFPMIIMTDIVSQHLQITTSIIISLITYMSMRQHFDIQFICIFHFILNRLTTLLRYSNTTQHHNHARGSVEKYEILFTDPVS